MRTEQLNPIGVKEGHGICHSEDGYALIVSLMFMVLLTILGLGATTTTIHELQISSNDSARKSAFYAAEAGRSYVEASTSLYSSTNIAAEPGNGVTFPDSDDPTAWLTIPGSQSEQLQGEVVYVDSSAKFLRGSGNEAGELKAHVYKMTCNGRDINSDSKKSVEAGFYRVGL